MTSSGRAISFPLMSKFDELIKTYLKFYQANPAVDVLYLKPTSLDNIARLLAWHQVDADRTNSLYLSDLSLAELDKLHAKLGGLYAAGKLLELKE